MYFFAERQKPMYLLGIDIGTSSTKSAVFDESGKLIGQAAKDYVFESQRPGYAEQDPSDWWEATKISIRGALENSGVSARKIAAVGFSGQMHGMVPLDREGNAVRKAILHCDLRTSQVVGNIKEQFGKQYESIVYNPVFPGFQAVSTRWMRDQEPENYERTARIVCPKDYVRYKLTGILQTDHTDASGTLLYDMAACSWSDEIFRLLDINRDLVLDHPGMPFDVAGTVTSESAAETGLIAGTPVVFGGADQVMQSTGNGIYEPGTMMATIGTSGQVLTISDRPVLNPRMNTHTFRHINDHTWFALGAVLFAGCTLNWFKRNMCGTASFEDLSSMAETIKPGCDGLVFFPCMGGERTPYMDPKTRGLFTGFTMMHTQAHFARAIMEGVSYAIKDSINTIEGLYGKTEKLVCAGGGVKGRAWAQIQADIYGRSIYISNVKEQACLGAAIAAGIGAGAFSDLKEACQAMCDPGMTEIDPIPEHVPVYEEYYRNIYRKIYDSNAAMFHEIDTMTMKDA